MYMYICILNVKSNHIYAIIKELPKMINKRLSELSCLATKKNLLKPSHCTRKPYQKPITKHRLVTLNITPVEIDCVKRYGLISHSARTLPSLGKPF